MNRSSPPANWAIERSSPDDQTLLREDLEHGIPGVSTRPCTLASHSAEGCWLVDGAGRRYLDMYGNNCHHIGHSHPKLLAALRAQLGTLTATARGVANPVALEFAKALRAASRWQDAKVVSARTGSDAIETALFIARASTGRYKTLSFYGAYHGRAAGALSVGGRASDRQGLGPLLPGALHVPPPFVHGSHALGEGAQAYAEHSVHAIRQVLEYEGDIAAVIGETIRNGPHAAPDWFWPEVKRLCEAHGTLLILDEVATGLGKTGTLFNYWRYGFTPDILVIGKALGGGAVAQSAVLADPRLRCDEDLNLGYFTHEKNPLGARAGIETLAILQEERLPENAAALQPLARDRLARLVDKYPNMVRGMECEGLMMSLGFQDAAQDAAQGGTSSLAKRCFQACVERGVLPTPARKDSLTFSAPLSITADELTQALDMLDDALSAMS